MSLKPFISIVSPVYQAENILPELVRRIETSINNITDNYEILLVEDCGKDSSWLVISELTKVYPKLKGIKLSRNFGQHYAITAGLDCAKGEWVVVMDCDLQDQPEEIIKLYTKAQEGYEIVLAKRINRHDKLGKKFASEVFYKFLGYMTDTEQDSSIANFGIYHKKVINSIVSMREQIKFFPAAVKWVGYKRTSIEIEHSNRFEGVSSYNLVKLLKLGFDTIIAFSEKPLRLVVKLGVFIATLSFIMAVVLIIMAFMKKFSVIGWPSLIISVCFFSGLIIFILGIIGLYLSRVFNEVKHRPLYLIDKKENFNE